MEGRFTNSVLAERSGIPHSKIKRYAREFLEPDPQAGRQSGYARMYSDRDAFRLIVGAYLVSDLKLEVYQARRIIDDLLPWFESNGLLPGAPKPDDARAAAIWHEINLIPTADPSMFGYLAKIYYGIAETSERKGDGRFLEDRYVFVPIGNLPASSLTLDAITRHRRQPMLLPISMLLERFETEIRL